MSIPPQAAGQVARAVSETAEPLVAAGHQLIVLTSPSVRAQVKQILDAHLNGAVVLSYNEVTRGLDVESLGLIQSPAEERAPVGAGAA
jgi:flagellar biosynthesis protein FlhA